MRFRGENVYANFMSLTFYGAVYNLNYIKYFIRLGHYVTNVVYLRMSRKDMRFIFVRDCAE